MPLSAALHLLYTANLRGDLTMLPRLHTFIRHLKALPMDEGEDVMLCAAQPIQRRTLLLDLGNACAPDVWHCAATGGRSMLIALDAMGYDAANVAGALTDESQEKLRANLLGMTLIDGSYSVEEGALTILTRPGAQTRLDGDHLHLASLRAGQVGIVHLNLTEGKPFITAHTIFDLPPNTAPDATIAGAVEFILSEARLYAKKG